MNEMAQVDVTNFKPVPLTGDITLEELSGWMIWEIVIVTTFIILSTLTVYFFLTKTGFFSRKRKRKRILPIRKKSLFLRLRKSHSQPRTTRRVGKKSKKNKPALIKGKKRNTRKASQKSGTAFLRKLPFVLDPNSIKSYTKKYLAGNKIKATWEKIRLVGVDSDNNRLDFAVYLLTKEFMWRPGSADVIEYNKGAVKPGKFFKNKGLKKAFKNAAGLISIGVVTDIVDKEQKEGLAQARAENMVVWLKKSLPRKTVDYLLLLESPLVVSGEAVEAVVQPEKPRPVLWICLQSAAENVDVEGALKDALSRAIQLPFDLDSYQKVSLINIHK